MQAHKRSHQAHNRSHQTHRPIHIAVAVAVAVTVLAATTTAATSSTEGRRQDAPPFGWRFESSLGAQIAVPANWAVNDSGCGITRRPSVVRGKGLQTLCYTREPASKELAIIQEALEPDTVTRATTVAGVPAERGEKRLVDGRYAGWISVPSRHVAVDVRTRDPETTVRILHSLQLVDPDHLGCPTRQPPKATKPQNQNAFVRSDPATISVCYYGGKDRLQASAEIKNNAHQVAAALNAAPLGRNPDRPARTCDARTDPPGDDAALLMRDSAAPRVNDSVVRIRFSSCAGRGMHNGARTVQVTRGVIQTIMAPVHAGYSISGDLPA
jgi:hypothetical protein